MTPGMFKPPWHFDVVFNVVYLGRPVYGRKQRGCAQVVRRYSEARMSAGNENARRWLNEEGGEGVAPGYGGRV